MNNLNNIPGEIIKTSALPENVPTHLIGVIMGTSPQTVKYSTQALAYSVSQLMTNVVKTDEFYADPSWITALSWDKLTNVPSFSTSLASLSDVQLGTLSAGEALVYNGTKWVNQSVGELDTLNSVTTRGNTTTNAITTGGLYSPYLRLDTAATTTLVPGMFRWNDADGTVDLRLKGDNVTLQLGQETVVRVVNKTGADLLESQYKVVRVRIASEGGAQGQRLAVVLAQGLNDPGSVTTLGIVTEDIGNNQEGFITVFGNVSGINTTGSLQGETWVDGDVLYLSPTTPGAITKVKPVAPQHTVVLGYVVYAHANNGKIFVKVDNGYELEELHDVLPTPYVNKGVLYRDTATNLWKSATVETLLGGTPLLTTPTLAQVTSAGNTTTNAISVGGLTVSGNDALINGIRFGLGGGANINNVAIGNLALNANTANGNVAVGGSSLKANTTGESNVSVGWQSMIVSTTASYTVSVGQNALLRQTTGNHNVALGYQALFNSTTGTNNVAIGSNAGQIITTGINNIFIGYNSNGLTSGDNNRTWIGNSSTATTWLGGNVLIGTTTDAGYKLDVNGTTRLQGLVNGFVSLDTAAKGLYVLNDSSAATRGIIVYQNNNGVHGAAMQFLKSRGTYAAPTGVSSGDIVGAFTFNAYIGNYSWDRSLFGATMTSSNGISQFFITGNTNNNYTPNLLIAENGNVVVGPLGGTIITTLTLPTAKFQVTGSITASSALAQGVYFNNTLVAAANNDVLVGLDINPTFTNGAFTGVSNYALRVTGISLFAKINASDTIRFLAQGNTSRTGFLFSTYSNNSIISGALVGYDTEFTFNPNDGNATYTGFAFSTGINQTGTATGITRGIYINPLLTSAYDFRAIETKVGKVIFGSTSGNVLIGTTTDAGYRLDVNGTARVSGLLTLGNDINITGGGGATLYGTNNGGSVGVSIKNTAGASNSNVNLTLIVGSTNRFSISHTNTNNCTTFNQYDGTTLVERMRLFNTGNFAINTTTDAGYKLDVNGSTRIKGTGTTSSTTAFRVQNSAGTNTFNVADNGDITLEGSTTIFLYNPSWYWKIGNRYTGGLEFTDITGGNNIVLTLPEVRNSTSGTEYGAIFRHPFKPTSGTANMHFVQIQPVVNQTGGANGITRGIYINPTLTAAADFRAIDIETGSLVLGRMTSDPTVATNGMIYYNTTTNKFRGYENGAWTNLI